MCVRNNCHKSLVPHFRFPKARLIFVLLISPRYLSIYCLVFCFICIYLFMFFILFALFFLFVFIYLLVYCHYYNNDCYHHYSYFGGGSGGRISLKVTTQYYLPLPQRNDKHTCGPYTQFCFQRKQIPHRYK